MHDTENSNPADHRAGASWQSAPGGDSEAASAFSGAAGASERRRHARHQVINRQLVTVKLGSDNGGLLLDLSAGGAALQCVAPLRSSAASPFAFRLPRLNSPIEGTGVFVWVDNTGLAGGLRFEQLSPEGQKLLEQWLRDGPNRDAPPSGALAALTSALEALPLEAASGPVEASLSARDPELVSTLKLVAERVHILSHAKGVCIALKEEQGGLVCATSVGTAPDVGVTINLERGLAAECVASREPVLCDEAQHDPRVDAATRRQMGLGSAALFPLIAGNTLFGVLGIFSDQPRAFSQQTIRRLRDWIMAPAAGQEIVFERNAQREPAPAVVPRPAAAVRKPAMSSALPAGSARRTFTAILLACLLLLAAGLLYRRQVAAPALPLHSQSPPAKSPSPLSSPRNPVSAPGSSAAGGMPQQVGAAPEHVQELTPLSEIELASRRERTERRTPPVPHSPETSGASQRLQAVRTLPPEAPAEQAASAAVPADKETSPPTSAPVQESKELQATTAPAPPAVAVAKATVAPPLAHVELLTTLLETRPRIGGASGLPAPELRVGRDIPYPAAAVAQNRQGSVVLRVSVGRAGAVDNVQVLDGDPVLSAEAVGGVRQWRFKPYKVSGREVGTELLVTVNFLLSR